MTDAKGPYKFLKGTEYTPMTIGGPTGNHGTTLSHAFLCNILNAAYAAGLASLLPTLEKAATSLEEVYEGYLDIMPDGSSLFDWKAWALEAKEAIAALREQGGRHD